MGIAAYNRGSRHLSETISREQGTHREPIASKPRPPSWGEKSRLRAEARAVSILRSNIRVGRNISLEILAGAVQDAERVSEATATEAARKAFAELEPPARASDEDKRRSNLARKPRPGSGERFRALSQKVARSYLLRGYAPEEAAIIGQATAAKVGRAKYGPAEMASMAQAGRTRRRKTSR